MAVSHLDRLSATDASFLNQESDRAHMHIGAVLVFEGPAAQLRRVRRARRGAPAPRAALPAEAGLSSAAVRTARCGSTIRVSTSSTTCATPRCRRRGTTASCSSSRDGVFSQQLDRSKPLWEMWLVQGLEDNRFAIVTKTHHALVDGVSGVDLATVLFDANPVPGGLTPPIRPWEAQPEPSDAHLLARGVENVAKVPLRLGRRALKVGAAPARDRRRTRSRWPRGSAGSRGS